MHSFFAIYCVRQILSLLILFCKYLLLTFFGLRSLSLAILEKSRSLDCDEDVYSWEFTGNEKCLGMCALSGFRKLKHTLNFLPVELGVLVLKNTNTHYGFGYTVLKTVVLRGHG